MKTREEVLIEQIKKASSDYYTTGTSSYSDQEFDALVEELESINPNAEILSKREYHGDDWNYKLEILPFKLYSIKKVKTFKEIQNWIDFVCKKVGINNVDNIELILTPKYDGIKLLHNDGNFYTRYETGEQGYNVTNRISRDIPKHSEMIGTEGELIISKSNFKEYCSGYTSSRNFIPALFSSKERLANQDKIEYIRYSMYGGYNILDKEAQILYCNTLNNVKVPYLKVCYKDLTEEMIIKFYFDNLSNYEYDGVVIDINQEIFRRALGETQKYLDCCRAYKGDALFNDFKDSQIEEIVWQMSRYGKLTPVAKITPVMINEGIVSNVSLYNAAYINKNNIHVGQKIRVTRRGKINPKIISFLSIGEAKLPNVCPFCGKLLNWNESEIDLICTNKDCVEKQAQKNYYFFKTIGVQNFGLESIKAYTYKGFKLIDFFDKNKFFNTNVEGIGNITKCDFLSEIKAIKENGIELEKIQEASGCFQGIGSSTLKILNTLNLDLQYLDIDRYYNEKYKECLAIDGIGKLTADAYFEAIYKFYNFYSNIKKYVPIKQVKEKETSNKFEGYNIVFTGFRNEEWKLIVESQGGKILSGVSSNCNLLVVKDINSTSSKMQKAKSLGIKVISMEEFSTLI